MSASTASSGATSPSIRKERGLTGFLDSSPEGVAARKIYLKIFAPATFIIILVILSIFSIFWGALWKIPAYNLPGIVVDFDGGFLGETVVRALNDAPNFSKITWSTVPASQFSSGIDSLSDYVFNEKTWVALSINQGASDRLLASLAEPNPEYDGTLAITVLAVEARNENAFRSIIRTSVQATLDGLKHAVALQVAQRSSNATNLSTLLSVSPQTIISPLSYQLRNLIPFDTPVATAVTFVGMLYQLILSFFVVMVGMSARHAAGYETNLSTLALVKLRLASSFTSYLIISLFISVLSIAFQLDVSRKFGNAGFVVFWMVNYACMLSVGLALESLVTLLTQKGIPFFMLTWIIANISVSTFPIEVMPKIFRYGYAAPFYNVSRAMRTVIFGTKNRVGFSFGILIVWIAISCFTLPLFQYLAKRKQSRPSPQASTDRDADTKEEEKAHADQEP
ncbi:hypothetical protein CVT24_010478 [Panaeolus cyanescens]|uniref:DUF3533 domain-containing protein n=1 Tax=Panaeolus cyanescens TaxID=181874 RepID=A0A409YVY3_9AGAR|nr:hypothetical protein CVT24_010478 [Panaeolus cyanescens]